MQPAEPVRVALIHALQESLLPARQAFAKEWPEAFCFDLLDSSLAVDLADAGQLDSAMLERFETLAHYSLAYAGKAGNTQAIMFTCSAFGPAIDVVKGLVDVPVLRPNESAFVQALEYGDTIGLLVTYGPALESLRAELEEMASEYGRSITVKPLLAGGALDALKAGDGKLHDRLAAQACAGLGDVDVLVLGQFSLARAAQAIRQVVSAPVLTTPDCAVRTLRKLLAETPLCNASTQSL